MSFVQGFRSELPQERGENQTFRRIDESKRTRIAAVDVSLVPRPGWDIGIRSVQNQTRRTVRGGRDGSLGRHLRGRLQRRGGRLHCRRAVRVELSRGQGNVGARRAHTAARNLQSGVRKVR